MRGCLLATAIFLVVVTSAYAGFPCDPRPIGSFVEEADLIVTGKLVGVDQIQIDTVLLGPAKPSEIICVPELNKLSLSSFPSRMDYYKSHREWCNEHLQGPNQEMDQGKPLKDPLYVLFLKRDEPNGWKLEWYHTSFRLISDGKVYGYCTIWDDWDGVPVIDETTPTPDQLFGLINSETKRRAAFEAGKAEKDPKKRIAALLPFVQEGPSNPYFIVAATQFAHTGPEATPYLKSEADRHTQSRPYILFDFSLTKDKTAVPYLVSAAEDAKKILDEYSWKKNPAETCQIWQEWQSALYSISDLAAPDGLPFLRRAMDLVVQQQDWYNVGTVANGMQRCPSVDNLPSFRRALLLMDHTRSSQGGLRAYDQILYALSLHRYPETVRMLIPWLDSLDTQLRGKVESTLTTIVGIDLGKDKEPWLEWYERSKPSKKPSDI